MCRRSSEKRSWQPAGTRVNFIPLGLARFRRYGEMSQRPVTLPKRMTLYRNRLMRKSPIRWARTGDQRYVNFTGEWGRAHERP